MEDIKVRKSCLKNIYCATCKKWMTEFNVSRHISSKLHMKKLDWKKCVQKQTLSFNTQKSSTCSAQSSGDFKNKTPEKQQDYEHFQLQSDTIKKCRHTHENIILEGCSDFEASQSPLTDDVKKQPFDDVESINTTFEEIPQNQLGVLGIEDCWDFEVALLGGESDISANGESVNTLQPISTGMVQNELITSAEFPIEVLSGGFSEPICPGFHNNQIAYYRCHVCNSATSSDYVSW